MISKFILKIVSIISNKTKIRTDLIMHFGVSFGLSSFFSLILLGSFWGLLITMIIGVGKEIYDIYKPNPTGFSLDDLLFDLIGGILGYSLILIIL